MLVTSDDALQYLLDPFLLRCNQANLFMELVPYQFDVPYTLVKDYLFPPLVLRCALIL